MIMLLFAMPPLDVVRFSAIGLLLVVLIVAGLVTATRRHERRSEQVRRIGLALMAVVSGPSIGAFLAFVTHALGHLQRADVGYTYTVFTGIGAIAGLVGGVLFGITALLAARDVRRDSCLVKADDARRNDR